MKTTLLKISPTIAREMLRGNSDNRPMRQSHIVRIASDMTNGRWQTTHQGIAFADDSRFIPWGRILDGQHRLHAVILSGKTVEMMVTVGADPETYRVLDINKVRVHYDRIHLVDDAGDNMTICKALSAYFRNAKGVSAPSVDDLEAEFLERTEHWIWATKVMRGPNRSLNVASVNAAFAIYHSDAPTKAEAFVEPYLTGAGMLTPDSPILLLREGILAKRIDTGRSECYWKAMAAMRAHRDNKRLGNLVACSQDFHGNEYSRLKHAREKIGIKSAETKRAKDKDTKDGKDKKAS